MQRLQAALGPIAILVCLTVGSGCNLLSVVIVESAMASAHRSAANTKVERGKWTDQINWRQLRQGMTEEQVIALLGEPGTITEAGKESQWYYGGGRLAGIAVFKDAALIEWSEP